MGFDIVRKSRDHVRHEATDDLILRVKVGWENPNLTVEQLTDMVHTRENVHGDFEMWFEPFHPGVNWKLVERNIGDVWVCEIVKIEGPIKVYGGL